MTGKWWKRILGSLDRSLGLFVLARTSGRGELIPGFDGDKPCRVSVEWDMCHMEIGESVNEVEAPTSTRCKARRNVVT